MKSEIFFITAPAVGGWMAIRDVIEVDRKPVPDRPDLKLALGTLPAAQVAGASKAANSRFNLGRTQRNFNEPILSLLVRARAICRTSPSSGNVSSAPSSGTLVTLTFTKRRRRPSFATFSCVPRPPKGELAVDAATGRVARPAWPDDRRRHARAHDGLHGRRAPRTLGAEPTSTNGTKKACARRKSARTQLENTRSVRGVVCEAKYSNYRRFETTARIKKSPGDPEPAA